MLGAIDSSLPPFRHWPTFCDPARLGDPMTTTGAKHFVRCQVMGGVNRCLRKGMYLSRDHPVSPHISNDVPSAINLA